MFSIDSILMTIFCEAPDRKIPEKLPVCLLQYKLYMVDKKYTDKHGRHTFSIIHTSLHR